MAENPFAAFTPKKEWLVCVDSDGCAMDTMDSKHHQAFCPELINVYGLQQYDEIITPYWMQINLYSRTRGINRFKGLAATLRMLAEKGIQVPHADELCDWVDNSPKLSNPALEEAIANGGGEGLVQALEWSRAVNAAIVKMGDDSKPFPGARDALAAIHPQTDTAVVSSANGEAIAEEWTRHGLIEHMDIALGQDAGTKEACLVALTAKGYAPGHVLMVGDALGDLAAAQHANALFYPILVGKEKESWDRLVNEALPRFLAGTYAGEYQEQMLAAQREILR